MRQVNHRFRSSSRPWSLLLLAAVTGLLGACGPSSFRDINAKVDPSVGQKSDAARADAGAKKDGLAVNSDEVSIEPGNDDQDAADAPPGLAAPDADPAGSSDTGAGGKKPTGAACAAGEECSSSFCADGICCSSACTERCSVCNAAGSAGTCKPSPAGEDLRNECATDPAATCGRDGTCDGSGGCRLYPATAECEPGGCQGTNERSARLCDGKGVCLASATRACTSTTCQNGSCATACASADDCLPGFFCEEKSCRLKRPLGQPCASPGQCATGVCSGGVCCNVACDRACVSCTLAGKVGTCSLAPAGEDPGERCSPEAASSCGRDGACDGAGRCRVHAAGTECAAAACSANAANSSRICDGLGTCQASTRSECGAFTCAAGTCATTCTPGAGCAAGFVCNGGTCVAEGLLLHWRFDEEDNAVVRDASGNGLDGIFLGPPVPSLSLPPTRFTNPRSRSFDASKRHAALITPLPAALKLPALLTLSVWYQSRGIKLDGQGAELISLANNQLLRLLPAGFEVSKRVKKGAAFEYVKCFSAPPRTDHLDGQWHHLATVIDATSVRIFFDGVQVCAIASTDPLGFDRPGNFAAGRHGAAEVPYDLDGNLDDLRVYGRALSVPEIMALAAGGP